jgi:alpha-amylase/alpha-mannosidase (GH57 family)
LSQVALAFLWHQHQPYYPDDVAKENPMPWVRLHGVKDYYGMALHLLAVPEMRCAINLVPSLLVQIEAYTERGATDRHLQMSHKPADGLSESDCLFLLDNFFMAHPDNLIKPHARYTELHQRRAAGRNSAREALRRFAERDFRDLQVWFNLAWIHRLAYDRHPGLRELLTKGKHFSEADKKHVLDVHLEILRQLIPLHRQLAENGQVELTTTPFYHPILPLLLDKKHAREAMPEVKLPRNTAGYLDDAGLHLRRAVERHTQVFGKAPQGMWPAEGSVCQSIIPVVAEHGIRWIATDEEILNHSTHGFVSRDAKGFVRNPDRMYRAYKVAEGGHELGIVFRDHALSDLIGFHYQRTEPATAVDDFLRHVHATGASVNTGNEPALVSVILDGENCWEHYPDGGVAFLRTLYERICQSKDIRPVKIGEHLDKHPPRDTLPHLFAGSWINHNFAIWIGHEEDNTAWDALHRTREYLVKKSAECGARSADLADKGTKETKAKKPAPQSAIRPGAPGQSPIDRAWEEIYIAEGSDWFWWYGDDHSSPLDALFDYLFRKHLQNVYLLLGDAPPADLSRPISRKGGRLLHTLPRCFLSVKIDGRQTFFEWINAGHYNCQQERGTMSMAIPGAIKELYFGYDVRALLIRVDCDGIAREQLANRELRIGFVEPAGYQLRVTPARSGKPLSFSLHHQGQPSDAGGIAVAIDRIVEVAIPFARLGLNSDQPIQFFIELLEGDQSRDRAPREGVISLVCPSPDFEQQMWDVLY